MTPALLFANFLGIDPIYIGQSTLLYECMKPLA